MSTQITFAHIYAGAFIEAAANSGRKTASDQPSPKAAARALGAIIQVCPALGQDVAGMVVGRKVAGWREFGTPPFKSLDNQVDKAIDSNGSVSRVATEAAFLGGATRDAIPVAAAGAVGGGVLGALYTAFQENPGDTKLKVKEYLKNILVGAATGGATLGVGAGITSRAQMGSAGDMNIAQNSIATAGKWMKSPVRAFKSMFGQ